MADRVSAVFTDRKDAERAVDWLRENDVPKDAISVISPQAQEKREDAQDAAKGAGTGAAVGAGVGALFGLAAALIPGVGPFITAGALAHLLGVTGGAMASGAIVGATSGGLAGALSHWGLNEAESKYYAGEIERGGTWVGVDLDKADTSKSTIQEAFRRYNGRFAT